MSSKNKPSYTYTPVEAEGHTPPYKIHKYFARRPHNVFNQLVNEFANEGEVILDPFCGGGVTIYEGLTSGRRVIGCDLNPLSIYIVRNMVQRIEFDSNFADNIREIQDYIEYLQGDFLTFEKDGVKYDVDWIETSMAVRCPKCGHITPLSNDLRVKNGVYHCSNEYCELATTGTFNQQDCSRAEYKYLYLVKSSKKEHVFKEFDINDEERYNAHIKFLKAELRKNKITVPQDLIPMDWDRQFEDGLAKKRINYFQDFFTKRNLYMLLLIKNKIDGIGQSITKERFELLRMVFSNVLKDTNIMSFTNDGWQGGKPTTWSKHAYWVPNQFCEVAILPVFHKSVERIKNAMEFNCAKKYTPSFAHTFSDIRGKDNILLYNIPVGLTDIPDNSVDAIITDPPYGSNVQYLELSHFWYPWNKDLYDRVPDFKLEAVANRKTGFKGAKSQYDYENNLFSVFKKSYECLKDHKYMTLTFNNKNVSSWLALLFSIFKSGFTFDSLYFQDGVKNYKQTSHTKAEGSPYGDFIYVFRKDQPATALIEYNDEQKFTEDLDKLFNTYLENFEDRNTAILSMFIDAMPIIEGFAKTYLVNKGSHSLYGHFNKTYFDKLYESHEEE